MKRKAIILLSSVMASALLVGGVFATFAVTDNADPLGINIAMTELDEDQTDYVTLKWGQSTTLNTVGKLGAGENRKVGVVSLEATQNYSGLLSARLDHVSPDKTTEKKLLDYLTVRVYLGGALEIKANGDLPDGEPILTIGKDLQTPATSGQATAVGSVAGTEYSIFVSLDEQAGTPAILADVSADKVAFTVDWGKAAGDEAATGHVVYFSKPSAWSTVHVYAYKGSEINSKWPGNEMTLLYDDVYQAVVNDANFDTLIFSDNGENETEHVSVTNYTSSLSYCDYDFEHDTFSWTAKPEKSDSGITATLNGEQVPLTNIKPATSDDKAQYRILGLVAGDVIAFKHNSTELHFPVGEEEGPTSYTVGENDGGDYIFYINKDYEVYKNKLNNYYLLGNFNEWTNNQPAYKLTPMNEDLYSIKDVVFTAEAKLKVRLGNAEDNEGYYGTAGTWDGCGFTKDDDGNVIVPAGTYSFNFYPNATNGNYITLG